MRTSSLLTASMLVLWTLIATGADAPTTALDKALSTLAETMAAQVKESGKKKITIIDFTDLQGNVSELGRFLAEELSVGLVERRSGFSVMDRANLKTILAEHKLTVQGLVDPENAKKLGQFAGVDALVLGTATPLESEVAVTAKIIATDTAEIVGAARARLPKTKDLGLFSENPTNPDVKASADRTKALKDAHATAVEKNSQMLGTNLLVKVESLQLLPGGFPNARYGNARLTLIVVNLSETETMGVALEDDVQHTMVLSNSRGDEFRSGGSDVSGIETAFGNNGQYRGAVTDIAPKGSIKIVAKSQAELNGKPGDYRPYRFQASFIYGAESQGRHPDLQKHNLVIDIQ